MSEEPPKALVFIGTNPDLNKELICAATENDTMEKCSLDENCWKANNVLYYNVAAEIIADNDRPELFKMWHSIPRDSKVHVCFVTSGQDADFSFVENTLAALQNDMPFSLIQDMRRCSSKTPPQMDGKITERCVITYVIGSQLDSCEFRKLVADMLMVQECNLKDGMRDRTFKPDDVTNGNDTTTVGPDSKKSTIPATDRFVPKQTPTCIFWSLTEAVQKWMRNFGTEHKHVAIVFVFASLAMFHFGNKLRRV